MKVLALYFMLAFMGLIMVVIIDMLSGMTLSGSIRAIRTSFIATSLQESITMVVFISLPLINAITAFIRQQNNKSIK